MTIYTVHSRPQNRASATEDVVLAPEAFSWRAFLFGPLWLLAHRLWLWALVWLIGAVAFAFAATRLSDLFGAAAWESILLLEFLLGLEANELLRRALVRRGRTELGVIAARGRDEAAARFFRRGIASEGAAGAPLEREPTLADRPGPAPEGKVFLTLFPEERAP